ncbi:MAG: polysaccharide biosynthesis C-terminal domain-containing protein [Bacteroidales bacterium]|nr:polysaccharide biosynthesis C-terminal domain-containing protein [Bacteroidales bacterium]
MAKRGFFRDFVGVLNSNIVSLLSALLMVVVLTRVLGTEGYGTYNALIVIPLIVVSFTHLGIRGASIYLLGIKKYDENKLVSSVILILAGSGLAGMILSAVAFWFYQVPAFNLLLITLVLFIIPLRLTTIYAGGIFYGKDEIKQANQLNWMINLLNLVLAVVLVWWLNFGLTGAVVATLAANLYVAIKALELLYQQFNIKPAYHSVIVKHLLSMGILFSMSFFVLQLNYKIDILLLERLSTIEEVGLYSLATQIAEQLWQIPLAISLVLFTRTANNETQSQLSNILPLTRTTLILVSFIAATLFLIAPFVIPLFFGEEFTNSSLILQIILPGIVVMTVFRVLSGQLAGMGKPQVTMYIFVPALILNILLNFLWIPNYGGNGAAMASNVSYFLGVSGYWIYYSRLHKISLLEIVHFRKSDFNALNQLIQKVKSRWTN